MPPKCFQVYTLPYLLPTSPNIFLEYFTCVSSLLSFLLLSSVSPVLLRCTLCISSLHAMTSLSLSGSASRRLTFPSLGLFLFWSVFFFISFSLLCSSSSYEYCLMSHFSSILSHKHIFCRVSRRLTFPSFVFVFVYVSVLFFSRFRYCPPPPPPHINTALCLSVFLYTLT